MENGLDGARKPVVDRDRGFVVSERSVIEKPPIDNCPIVLDLESNGLSLSGAANAVRFDIDADGVANELAWTRRQSDEKSQRHASEFHSASQT